VTVPESRERLIIVIVGHVDHGKSTVVGRLLADTGSLPKGKLERIQDYCTRNSKPFEYAFLLDALKDEQAQGITIDIARIFFKTPLRDYLIMDAPGHIEFLKNMVSGASHAGAALLVIDAAEGIRENSKRHGYLLSLLGIRQIAVLVNKMDAVAYGERTFQEITKDYQFFLDRIGMRVSYFIPTAAMRGENIVARAAAMPWFSGPTVLEALDTFRVPLEPLDKPFRMPVQDVYKFTALGDDRRIVAGTLESGSLRPDDEVVFYPSGKTSAVRALERFPARPESASAGEASGITLTEQIYVKRGEIAARKDQARPQVARRLRTSVFWLGREPLRPGQAYTLKLGTARVRTRIQEVICTIDASSLQMHSDRSEVRRHEAAECLLELEVPIACERAEDHPTLGRFVLVDNYEISGGGLIREILPDPTTQARERVIFRNLKWRKSFVGLAEREERLAQRSGLVLVTGSDNVLRRDVAKELERRLFAVGRFVYFLGIGSLLYGVDADIREGSGDHTEDLRRLAEVAHILVDTGLILIVTASCLLPEDLDLIRTSIDATKLLTVWVGPDPEPRPAWDLVLDREPPGTCVDRIEERLRRPGGPLG
jgi:bifunctional enzyme CysN/CysC